MSNAMQYFSIHHVVCVVTFMMSTLAANLSLAQNNVEYKANYTGGPALQVTAGDYTMVFSERKSWTFREIIFKDIAVTSPNGAHQAVLREKQTPQGMDRFLGTGHRREQIESMEVIVLDPTGKVINTFPVAPGLKLNEGDSYVIHKKSKFHSEVGGLYYLHDAKITISRAGIKQDFSFKAVADDYSNVDFMYAFMHMFPKTATSWLAGDDREIIDQGEFLSDRSFTLNKDIRYLLVHDPQQKTGVAVIYPEVYPGYKKKNTFWNRERDSKHYLQVEPKKVKGEEFSYSALFKVYEAEDAVAFRAKGKEIVNKETR